MENIMGQRIRELRQKQGLTQERLGEYIGVSRGAINKIEKGTTENLKRSQIETLAKKLGCTPTYLMGWDNKPTQQVQELGRINRITDDFEAHLQKAFKDVLIKNNMVNINNDIYDIIQKILEEDKLYYNTFELDDETTNNIKIQLKILSSYIQFKIERNK